LYAREELLARKEKLGDWYRLFDDEKFKSEVFQRPYIYLSYMQDPARQAVLDHFSYTGQPTDLSYRQDCLDVLLRNFCVKQPTWMELTHFASFLNHQLRSSEASVFCNPELMREEFPGMKNFVVRFLIQMSKDFASRSVQISDQSHGGSLRLEIEERRSWEKAPHPYIFFNEDGHSMSFFGFKLDRGLNLIDERTNQMLEPKIMTGHLYQGLHQNSVPFNQPFERKTPEQKLQEICNVLGIQTGIRNPDLTYELTTDNVMKMLAIYMRFRCNIPVVIMGETGCGKTRLIRFLCELLRLEKPVENLLILKTHGGVTEENIHAIVRRAIKTARDNKQRGVGLTVLFFDEANTTNMIGTIKEVMCDRLVDGEPIPDDIGLQFVAAVNPYREHSEEMICRLEKAGLGYHIKADRMPDRLGGGIPMRRLVYRVKEIPPSMFPLIWDFGVLDNETELKYIRQMVDTRNNRLDQTEREMLLKVLSRSQSFMRQTKDECSFVSLRDVERMLTVLEWFQQGPNEAVVSTIGGKVFNHLAANKRIFLTSLILALGVGYYVRLDERRKNYVREISQVMQLRDSAFTDVIDASQSLLMDQMWLAGNIAQNAALKENVWMMFVCISLRIPLFLVGKPGSSKTLAKSVITDVMQGDMSYSDFFRRFMEIHMVSFQCSPLATAGGILSTFRQCQKFQEKRDLNRFAAVCVLDEVGLAEDSPKMPLKALHPLLEDGCVDEEIPEPHKKVKWGSTIKTDICIHNLLNKAENIIVTVFLVFFLFGRTSF
jgi:hypothetical protein